MRTKRLHDLGSLKEQIKQKATEGRTTRALAREKSGLDRHYMKFSALCVGAEARDLLLAYGYLRGRSISTMESATTHPVNLVNYDAIIEAARPFFNRGPEAEPWEEEISGEHQVTTHVPDNRNLFDKMLGRPAPEPKVTVKRWVDYVSPPGWDEFCEHVEADVKAWNKQCELAYALKAAQRRLAAK